MATAWDDLDVIPADFSLRHLDIELNETDAPRRRLRQTLARLREPDVAEAALKTCEEIDRLESDADRVMRAAMSRLFRDEPDVREVIKMKAIYELLEEITDRCLDVANLAEGISLENS